MSDRKNAERVASQEGLMDNAGRIDQVCCKAEVKLAGGDQMPYVARWQDEQGNPGVRMFPSEYCDRLRHDRVTGRKKGRDANLPRPVIANSSSGGTDRINAEESCFDFVIKHAGLRRGNQTVADPRKEKKTDRSLQLNDAPAYRRLCYAKDLRRSRRRTALHYGLERLDLSKIHAANSLSRPGSRLGASFMPETGKFVPREGETSLAPHFADE